MNQYVYSVPVFLVVPLLTPVLIVVMGLFQFKCLPIKLLHKLLRKLDVVEKGPEDSDEKPQSTLHGSEVPVASVGMFSFYLSNVCSIIVLAFMDTLLVQRTTSCNPKVECFLVSFFPYLDQDLYTMPVSCNNLTDDSLFVCYKFHFDLTYALASAGGLITIAKLTINITTSVLSWLMKRQTRKGQKIVTFTIISSLVICFFLFIICMIYIPELIVIFATDGFISTLQLLLLFFSVGAATLAVARVYRPDSVKN